jgi:hypothetical protein
MAKDWVAAYSVCGGKPAVSPWVKSFRVTTASMLRKLVGTMLAGAPAYSVEGLLGSTTTTVAPGPGRVNEAHVVPPSALLYRVCQGLAKRTA